MPVRRTQPVRSNTPKPAAPGRQRAPAPETARDDLQQAHAQLNTEERAGRTVELTSQARRVEGYIRATGCTPKDLYAANGKPDEQVKILVTELARRELS